MGHMIMIIDDDPLIRRSLSQLLKGEGYDIVVSESGNQGIEMIEESQPDVALLDLQLGDMDGLEVLRRFKLCSLGTRVIMITAYGTIESTVQAMREGAFDYLTKPFDNRKVKMVVKKAIGHKPVSESIIDDLCRDLEKYGLAQVIAESPEMRRMIGNVKQLGASSDTTVLIEGESGAGKEWVAKYIHFLSSRFEKPFVKLNCACIPASLAESELFGYERGAFTGGGKEGKPGLFDTAEGGTVLFDEIGELPLDVQSKLLTVIEDGTYFRVGGTREVSCNVRIVAATNKNLLHEAEEKRFRQDLYYRLSVVRLVIPPLRERQEDILPLARHFLGNYCKKLGQPGRELSPEAEKFLTYHYWKGNVRELRNAMERVVVMEKGLIIHPGHLDFLKECAEFPNDAKVTTLSIMGGAESPPLVATPDKESSQILATSHTYDETMKNLLISALCEAEGNQVKAAKILDVSRAKLRYQLTKYGLL